jgi:hypothetical protein
MMNFQLHPPQGGDSMRPTRFRAFLLLLLLLFWPRGEATASTVIAMSLEQMTDRAQTIFLGRVTGTRADWNAERTRIYTYVTLDVDQYLKGGNRSRTETIRLLGGRVGPYLAMIPGTPDFRVGEDVLLFTAGAGARIPTVLGLSLGKFTVVRDANGESIVKRDISSLMLANYRSDSRKPGDPVNRYRLSDVEARIRALVR